MVRLYHTFIFYYNNIIIKKCTISVTTYFGQRKRKTEQCNLSLPLSLSLSLWYNSNNVEDSKLTAHVYEIFQARSFKF